MILVIGRAECYSPNSVDRDAAIVNRVGEELVRRGFSIVSVQEDALVRCVDAEAYVSMGRHESTLSLLTDCEAAGRPVVNSPSGVALCCDRRRLTAVLRRHGVPVPPDNGPHGLWLKKAHGVSQSPLDVQFAANEAEAKAAVERMRQGGITDIVTSAHIEGDLVKFYGVSHSGFFRFYYPGDDGQWKFGDEARNGRPHHYPFIESRLQAIAERAARATGVEVYGGDCIVAADGSISIIDFNDWPSFSRCREEAAIAIAEAVVSRLAYKQLKKRA